MVVIARAGRPLKEVHARPRNVGNQAFGWHEGFDCEERVV